MWLLERVAVEEKKDYKWRMTRSREWERREWVTFLRFIYFLFLFSFFVFIYLQDCHLIFNMFHVLKNLQKKQKKKSIWFEKLFFVLVIFYL